MRTSRLHVDGKNRLLELLPRREKARILSTMHPVPGAVADVLFEGRAPITHVYFPTAGVISLGFDLKGGRTAEVGLVGNEGMAGLALLHKTTRNRVGASYKVAGGALRMPAGVFAAELRRRGPFEHIVHRYAEAFFTQIAQSTACNVRHTIEQRLCRWILMSHDRLAGDSIELTQAQLANMLGVRRAGVNIAAVALQKAGLIGYTRGVVGVLKRRGLEARSCECYKEVRSEFERLLS
jgi:CRP-like cAMP-binding protein